MQKSIRSYVLPKTTGTFSLRMPDHCRVLGFHGSALLVLGHHSDLEQFVDKYFVATSEGDTTVDVAEHHYIGTLTREQPMGMGIWYQHVFEWIPQAPISDFIGNNSR